MAEVVVLRASLPLADLAVRFAQAIGRGADVDLVVSGLRTRLLPGVVARVARSGRGVRASAGAIAFAPLFPKVLGLLLQARLLGRSLACRQVAGEREVVVEIRAPGVPGSG